MIKNKRWQSVGIVGYAGYVPAYRLPVDEVADFWGEDEKPIKESLGVYTKAVGGSDEDSLTMAVEAASRMLNRFNLNPKKIGAVFVGSESAPYAVKPTGSIVADILGMSDKYVCADLQFACKAATSGLIIGAGLIGAGLVDYALIIGTDKAQAKPGDVLEYTAGAGAAAVLLGRQKKQWLAKLKAISSVTTNTPDFWRRSEQRFPSHTGRFTAEPGYFYHVRAAMEELLHQTKKKVTDLDHIVLHMPNAKFPAKMAKLFKMTNEQLRAGWLVPKTGNPYTASTLLGLISILDEAKTKEQILQTAYGSGAGADAFWWETTASLVSRRKTPFLQEELKREQLITYQEYLKFNQLLII